MLHSFLYLSWKVIFVLDTVQHFSLFPVFLPKKFCWVVELWSCLGNGSNWKLRILFLFFFFFFLFMDYGKILNSKIFLSLINLKIDDVCSNWIKHFLWSYYMNLIPISSVIAYRFYSSWSNLNEFHQILIVVWLYKDTNTNRK